MFLRDALRDYLRECDYRLTNKNNVNSIGLNGKHFYPGTQTINTSTYDDGPPQTALVCHIRHWKDEHCVNCQKQHRGPINHHRRHSIIPK